MSELYGGDCELHYKVGGLSGGGSWVEAEHVRDVSVNPEHSEYDATTRKSYPYRNNKPVIKDLTIEVELLRVESDPAYQAFRNAYNTKTHIGIKALDKDNGEGPQLDMHVMSFPRTESLEEGVLVNITLKQTYVDTAPSWVP